MENQETQGTTTDADPALVDRVVNALRQPMRHIAFGVDADGETEDFAADLESLAQMCDAVRGFPETDGTKHSPELWAYCLRAKSIQIRDALKSH